MNTVNRRDFLKGVALASVAGVGASQAQAAALPQPGYDVLVVGGGPAGVCAAVAAARNGAKVLIVEQGNCLGGMATQGLVGPFMTCYDKNGRRQIIQGLFNEIVEKLVARGGAIHPKDVRAGTSFTAWITRGHDHLTPFEPEALKFLLDDLCAEAGVKILYHATFARPLLEGATIRGVDVLTKAGLRAIGARVVVDATGDGDVAFRAGVPCVLGDPARKGAMQPCSMFFRISNLPEEVVQADYDAHHGGMQNRLYSWYVKEAVKAGDWTVPRPHINIYRSVKSDEWFANVSRLNGVDATDPESLSAAETAGRRQVAEVMNLFRKYIPGGDKVRLVATGSTLGIRESRHVVGEYTLDKDDVLEGRLPADRVMVCSSAIDLHGGKGAWGTYYAMVKDGDYYGVPYRCLVPKKIDNLLVTGRCVSASSVAAAAIRVMPPAMALGEAAGTAAALCVQTGATPRTLDTAKLVAQLKAQNAFLG